MPILSCSNLEVRYGAYTAVQQVSFSINPGEYVCVVGANGSGKSTLVKTLLGLIPAHSGSVERHTGTTGYLPQQTPVQHDFPASVQEVVLSGCIHSNRLLPLYTRADRENARRNIELLHIEPLVKKSYRELSGGQQQRVLLARSLCAAKKLLVLDEPVTGLDPVVTDELYTIIRDLNRNAGMAILMVSHDIHRAVQNATHILHLDKQPLFYGTADDYRQTSLFNAMTDVETCSTHCCTHCGPHCNASHIHVQEGQHD